MFSGGGVGAHVRVYEKRYADVAKSTIVPSLHAVVQADSMKMSRKPARGYKHVRIYIPHRARPYSSRANVSFLIESVLQSHALRACQEFRQQLI